MERHRPRQATVAAADPLYAHAQPSNAHLSDAQLSDAQPAFCQPERPSPRLREHCPCLRSPDLVCALCPSVIRRNARRRPRRPVRCPRQPRQRSTSAAPSTAGHRGNLRRRYKILPLLTLVVSSYSFGCQCFVARIYCDGKYCYWAGKVDIWKQARELV
jgi:hypothetical protein